MVYLKIQKIYQMELLFLVFLLLVSCVSDSNLGSAGCETDTRTSCACSDGRSGYRTCTEFGYYGSCECLSEQTCESNIDCEDNWYCDDGQCVIENSGDECDSENDCPIGFNCDLGKCIEELECRVNSDCDRGQTCEFSVCVDRETFGELLIDNRSGKSIFSVSLTYEQGGTKGLLSSGSLIPARSDYTFGEIDEGVINLVAFSPSGCETPPFDTRITAGNQTSWTILDVDWDCPIKTGQLKIINSTTYILGFVYLTSTESDNWGSDLLDGEVILEGETHVFESIPVGIYDLRVKALVFEEFYEVFDIEIKMDVPYEQEITYLIEEKP